MIQTSQEKLADPAVRPDSNVAAKHSGREHRWRRGRKPTWRYAAVRQLPSTCCFLHITPSCTDIQDLFNEVPFERGSSAPRV